MFLFGELSKEKMDTIPKICETDVFVSLLACDPQIQETIWITKAQ
jgi:hypothetical protein